MRHDVMIYRDRLSKAMTVKNDCNCRWSGRVSTQHSTHKFLLITSYLLLLFLLLFSLYDIASLDNVRLLHYVRIQTAIIINVAAAPRWKINPKDIPTQGIQTVRLAFARNGSDAQPLVSLLYVAVLIERGFS